MQGVKLQAKHMSDRYGGLEVRVWVKVHSVVFAIVLPGIYIGGII